MSRRWRRNPRPCRRSRADHYLSLTYTTSTPAPGSAHTAGPVTGHLQTRYSGGVHAGKDLVFVLDGEAMPVAVTGYRVTGRQTGVAGKRRTDKSDEHLSFTLTPEQLRRVARAVDAEGRLGNVTFRLSRDDIAMFTAVQARIEKGL